MGAVTLIRLVSFKINILSQPPFNVDTLEFYCMLQTSERDLLLFCVIVTAVEIIL